MQPLGHPGGNMGFGTGSAAAGGGGGTAVAGLQDMQQRLQQQFYQQQSQQQQQPGGNNSNGMVGGMSFSSMTPQFSALQQQAAAAQGRLPPNHHSLASSSPALAMMQQHQQQQQQQQNPMSMQQQQQQPPSGANANSAFGNGSGGWTSGGASGMGMAGMNAPGSSMDASSGSSARLMAMAGLGKRGVGNGGGGMMDSSNSTMQNMQLLMQHQQQQQSLAQQGQNSSMPGSFHGMPGHDGMSSNNSMNAHGRMGGAGLNESASGGSEGNQTPPQQLLLQRQLANFQNQVQQGGGPQGAGIQRGISGAGSVVSSANLLQQHQQQLLAQIQQQQGAGSAGGNAASILHGVSSSSDMMAMMQQSGMAGLGSNAQFNPMMASQAAQTAAMPGMGALGSLNEQRLRMHQQNLLRVSAASGASGRSSMDGSGGGELPDSSTSNSAKANQGMSNVSQQQQQQQSIGMAPPGHPMGFSGNSSSTNSIGGMMANPNNIGSAAAVSMMGMPQSQAVAFVQQQQPPMVGTAMDSSIHSHRSNAAAVLVPNSNNNGNNTATSSISSTGSAGGTSVGAGGIGGVGALISDHNPLIDRFVGGWQSHDDLPDRRKVIFRIVELIQQMKPDASRISDKLPRMAKSLEEHLYRSAQTKEEYLNFATLKNRLHTIAQILDDYRTTGIKRAVSSSGGGHALHQGQQQQQGMMNPSDASPGSSRSGYGGTNNEFSSGSNRSMPYLENANGSTGPSPVPGAAPQSTVWNGDSNNNANAMNGGQLMSASNMNSYMAQHAQGGMAQQGNAMSSFPSNFMPGNMPSFPQGMGGNGIPGMMQQGSMSNMGQQGAMAQQQHGHGARSVSNFQGAISGQSSLATGPPQQPSQNAQWSNRGGSASGTPMMGGSSMGMMPGNVASMQNMIMQQMNATPGSVDGGNNSMPFGINQAPDGKNAIARVMSPQDFQNLNNTMNSQGFQMNADDTTAWAQTGNQMSAPSAAAMNSGMMSGVINTDSSTGGSRFTKPEDRRRVILQQQQRLLLLRHASKCNAAPACTTKFCSQMVTLWRHMKECRDRSCKTSHCQSSRCVLNHYRICKAKGQTATCEVCGPVMAKIKQQEQDLGGAPSSVDPLTKDQDMTANTGATSPMPTKPELIHEQNMSQQQQAPQGMVQVTMSSATDPADQQAQMQPMQAPQLMNRAKQNLESLKQLHDKQEQLMTQQRTVEEQLRQIEDPTCQQAIQLLRQKNLLQELRERCQQHQHLLQQELQMQQLQQQQVQPPQQQLSQDQGMIMQLHQSQMAMSMFQQQQQQEQQQLLAQDSSQDVAQQQEEPQQQEEGPAASTMPSQPPAVESITSTGKVGRRRTSQVPRAKRGEAAGKGRRGGKGKTLQLGGNFDSDSLPSQDDTGAPTAQRKRLSVTTPKERSQKKFRLPAQVKSEIIIPKVGASDDGAAGTTLPQQQSALIGMMSREAIVKHLESLNKQIRLSSRTVTHKCMPLIHDLIDDQFGWVFHDAVDPVALGLPDYFEVVKNPMHLALVKKKLENAIYSDMEGFARDVRLVFENAIVYNGESSEVGQLAQSMMDRFQKAYVGVLQEIESSQQNLESNGQACSLCGTQKRQFEPTILYCQGRCGLQQIKRKATYYTDRTKQNHWCESCYNVMSPDDGIALDDGTEIKKSELQEFKNDALPEEAWVQCDECHSWVHQICALFNGRTNKSTALFTCPHCFIKKDLPPSIPAVGDKVMKCAADLPKSNLSISIEVGLHHVLKVAYVDRAKELGVTIEQVEKVEGLTVRILSNVEKKHFVGDEMQKRYGANACPTAYPVRSKCIALFQTIHGVDTLLFAMYVYEYGQECPAPNRRRVYISYLDSVQYFEPKCYRTIVYHAILVEYLRHVKSRGFHTAHIWSCPPTPGDDYIFYCHPSHQLTPREDMLRSWYGAMLEKAKEQGIVIRSTNLFDEYFANEGVDPISAPRSDPTCLPYFEGDYIPGEIENTLKLLRQNENATLGAGGLSQFKDLVMRRLAMSLSKMKDNFIVAHLRNRRFAAAVERGDDVSDWREDSDEDLIRSKRALISGKDTSVLFHRSKDGGEKVLDKRGKSDGGETLKVKSDEIASTKLTEPASVTSSESGLEGIKPAIARHFSDLRRPGTVVATTADDDELVESEMFESRQQFLNYCQTNHCQFDELRRAKHSTMMVLFQLHNPSAPKFLQQCGACYCEITHGKRYRCNNCSNFDLCETCYGPVTSGEWAQRDSRFAHDKSHTFTPVDMEAPIESPKAREERQKSLKTHIQLLEHAGICGGPPSCSLNNCPRMKQLIEHVGSCETKPKKDCKICTRLLALCTMHARLCPVRDTCRVPFCDRIRERNGRLRKQQQLMDDRRRQAQNELYHAGVASA